MQIEISSTQIEEIQGEKNGRPYHIRKQSGYAHMGGKYPEAISFSLPKDAQPYPPGMYSLAVDNFYVGSFQALQLSQQLKLVPANK